MSGILMARQGLRLKAGCMEIVDGAKVSMWAERPPFRRGRYSVAIEDFKAPCARDAGLAGNLPALAMRLSRMENAGAMVGILSRLASAIRDPAPLFGPERSWRDEELTRHLTDKEIAILSSISSGIDHPYRIREVFGLGRTGMFLGRLELGAGSLISASYDEGTERLILTESGKKLVEKAKEEAPMRAGLEWAAALGRMAGGSGKIY